MSRRLLLAVAMAIALLALVLALVAWAPAGAGAGLGQRLSPISGEAPVGGGTPPNACRVLVVDADWDFDYVFGPNDGGRPYYTSTLDWLGVGYDLWEVESQGDPTAADMAGHDAVIWFTGYAQFDVFTPNHEAQVKEYLDGGGRFLLSSEDYYFYADQITLFMKNYLGIDDIIEDLRILTVVGNDGDPIGDGLGPYSLARPDDWYSYWPPIPVPGAIDDGVIPRASAGAPFRYEHSVWPVANSTRYIGGPFKSVYLAWPFEWVDTVEQRAEIMEQVLGWLDCLPVLLRPPAQDGMEVPEVPLPYTLTLANNSGTTESFSLSYDASWAIDGPSELGPLADGEEMPFVVTVTVTAGAGCYEADRASVTALGQGQPVSATAFLTTTALPLEQGSLEGTITDANTGLGIAGATVSVAVNNGSFQATTGSGGGYGLAGLAPCTYAVRLEAPGYDSRDDLEVTLAAGMTTTLDASLNAPRPALSHGTVSVEVPEETSLAFTVTLSNTGGADLLFAVSEEVTAGGPQERVVPPEAEIPWLTEEPVSGTVAPGQSRPIELTFDASGRAQGQKLTGILHLTFNDPYSGTLALPVEMRVGCALVAPPTPVLTPISNDDGNGAYLVNWLGSACAEEYLLQQDDSVAFDAPVERYRGPLTQATISGQAPGIWYYRVLAGNDWGESNWSNVESVGVAPAAPVLAISNPDGDGDFRVDWNDVTGAIGYTLQEDTSSNFDTPLVRTAAASYLDVVGQPVGTWYYRVLATGVAGDGAWSNVVSVVVLPPAPVEWRVYLPIVSRR